MLEYHERRPIYISKYGNNSKKESVHLKIVATKHQSHSERIYELGSELTSATHKANDRKEGVREEEVIACVNWILNICCCNVVPSCYGVCY